MSGVVVTVQDDGPGTSGGSRWPRWKRVTAWSAAGVVGFLVLMFVIGTVVGPPKKTADSGESATPGVVSSSPEATPTVTATTSAPSSTPTVKATTSAPAATPKAPAPKPKATPAPKPSKTGCGPERDVIVWMKVPGLPDSAQVLGSYNLATCESTLDSLGATSPKGAGYCTEAAWASDNPGYDADATPAKRLKKVQAVVGPAC